MRAAIVRLTKLSKRDTPMTRLPPTSHNHISGIASSACQTGENRMNIVIRLTKAVASMTSCRQFRL